MLIICDYMYCVFQCFQYSYSSLTLPNESEERFIIIGLILIKNKRQYVNNFIMFLKPKLLTQS